MASAVDGAFTSLNRWTAIVDVVDDEWLADSLSDDGAPPLLYLFSGHDPTVHH